ncbi:hypothetical protein O6H91_06G003200 [Diphasiastrum complanatum]|uniref:Uncharacterized protein n=1 Tax=Diphasiastrum complanatum TaxID=34168 RepID=A0ACC2DB39_DIPCM|nr:hypothetical protein O6H91_06G003200 [Diphasiastrum complanatum]
MEDSSSRALIATALNRILDICRGTPEGVSNIALGEQMQDVSLTARAQAINILLQKHQLQVFKHGDTLMYKEQSREEAGRLKGLQPEDLLVYQVIQAAKNDGIWTRDMKRETNLQQPQIAKAIKNLEARKLIKAVQCINNKTKKVYMLAELKPSEKITGGAWYSGDSHIGACGKFC